MTRTARSDSSRPAAPKASRRGPLPPTWLLLALLALGALHLLESGPRLVPGPWRLLGLVPLALGCYLTLRADLLFKRAGTEIKPLLPSSRLVTADLYARSRHPMYLGFVLLVLGAAVLAGTLAPFLVTVAFFLLLTFRFVLPEERHLFEQFGSEYEDYCRRVRRWI